MLSQTIDIRLNICVLGTDEVIKQTLIKFNSLTSFHALVSDKKIGFWAGEYIDLSHCRIQKIFVLSCVQGLCLQFNCHSMNIKVNAIFSKRATFWDALYIRVKHTKNKLLLFSLHSNDYTFSVLSANPNVSFVKANTCIILIMVYVPVRRLSKVWLLV